MEQIENEEMTGPNEVSLAEAADSLYDFFKLDKWSSGHPYIQAIGEAGRSPYISDDKIYVYLTRKPRRDENEIPTEWMGFKVETRLMGRIRPASTVFSSAT